MAAGMTHDRSRKSPAEDDEDPVDKMIRNTGCIDVHHAVQDCMAKHQDWRKCQQEVTEFRKCMAEGAKKNKAKS